MNIPEIALIDKQFLAVAAIFSKEIYGINCVAAAHPNFVIVQHHKEDIRSQRITDWAVSVSEELRCVYVIFRGSVTLLDWLANFSANSTPLANHPDVRCHLGYYHEISSEYQYIKNILESTLLPDYTLVITGHSKGGGLAQIFTHLLYNDSMFWQGHLSNRMACISFAAPMIFWTLHSQDRLTIVNSANAIHNFIIKGDPVPVAHFLLLYNDQAMRKLLGHITHAAINFITKYEDILRNCAEFVRGFQLVGNIYVANAANLNELIFDRFRHDHPNERIEDWSCVKTALLHLDRHSMIYYHEIVCKPNRVRRDYGLYFVNETENDALIVLEQHQVPRTWEKVSKHDAKFVPSARLTYDLKISVYDRKNLPNGVRVAFNTTVLAMTTFFDPTRIPVALGWRILRSRSRGNHSNHYQNQINDITTDGRFIIIRSHERGFDLELLNPDASNEMLNTLVFGAE